MIVGYFVLRIVGSSDMKPFCHCKLFTLSRALLSRFGSGLAWHETAVDSIETWFKW